MRCHQSPNLIFFKYIFRVRTEREYSPIAALSQTIDDTYDFHLLKNKIFEIIFKIISFQFQRIQEEVIQNEKFSIFLVKNH